MPETAKIYANGQPKSVNLPCSVAEFIEKIGLKCTQVVVERNGQTIPRADLGKIQLENGDKLEIVLPVAGG
jgi:thiamine biosynthesis protein ThiS